MSLIYLLGGSGYVGQAYQKHLTQAGIPFKSLRQAEIDYGIPSVLAAALRADKPDFLINAAGFTGKPNVDACELQKSDCLFGNAILPARIAQTCADVGVPWGHVSSGCIYTGARADGSGFTEEDPPNFSFRSGYCSFYSGTKALAEEMLADYPGVYIWRLRIPFDHRDGPRNYLSKLMRYERLLEAGNSVSQLQEFVAATVACWQKHASFGIYNVTNPGHITTREVVQMIADSGVCRKDFRFFEDEEQFMKIAARTPRSNCIMDSSKLRKAGVEMTEVHEAIARDLHHWQPNGTTCR